MAPGSTVTTEDLCPACGRTGYFDVPGVEIVWRFNEAPRLAPDFNLTWERFGVWRQPLWTAGRKGVGGMPGLVVSSRARAFLTAARVRRLFWGAVILETGASPRASRGLR